MKMFAVLSAIAVVLLIGCGEQKTPPVPVGEMNDYRDPAYGFKIQYPKEWKMLGTAGSAVFAKSQEVLDKFLDPRSGLPGAQVRVDVVQYGGKAFPDVIAAAKDDMKQLNYQIAAEGTMPEGPTQIGGKEALQFGYLIKATTKTNIYGHEIWVKGDTAVYKLDFEGYGDQYAAHAAVFDAMLKSFELPIIVAKKSDVWQPSPNLDTYPGGDFFTMKYPENLSIVQVGKGGNDFAMEMQSPDRRDCSIHIDVFGAKKLTVDKVWEQNKGRYKARGTGSTSVDGEKALWVDYSVMKDVNSRAWFVVKNDKVVRITVNYYAPQKDVYFPVFEKCVASIKLK